MLKCPKCNEELTERLPYEGQNVFDNYVEHFFICPNQHEFFDRTEQTDLLET